jgi:acyl-[acyl-carrier-protein]-phospholipid O-acyltransferase / long-chain-fatty-acid--[acyl-carrier-protein] ligase
MPVDHALMALEIPLPLVRFGIRLMVLALFRFRIVGREHVPKTGPALIVSNHLSLMDGFLIGWGARHRRVRFMIYRPYYEHWLSGPFLRSLKAIPIGTSGPRDLAGALKAARVELEAGHVVCIFAEGSVSRTGHMHSFKRGLERVVKGLNVPIVPANLDRVWDSLLSFKGGTFGGWRKGWRWPITVRFGPPVPATTEAPALRQLSTELAATSFAERAGSGDTLPDRFIRTARANWGNFAVADTTGRELTYGRTLISSILLAGVVRKLAASDEMVGVLMPATVGGALVNLGVAMAGKTAVNLNFTAGKDAMESALAQCNVRVVITSRTFLERAKLDAPQGATYVEDLLKQFSGVDKLLAAAKAKLLPAALLRPDVRPDTLATVIFSSGSTGVPKGVMLSHYNLVSNCDSVLEIFHLTAADRIVGILPFFHSFGYMATLWLPMLAACGAVYHPIPTDAKAIGELIQKYKATFLLATPTFCGAYTRKCTREQFSSLRYVVVGAEKLRDAQRAEFEAAFGKELLEGYGCTELSPVVGINTPDVPFYKDVQIGHKKGTIGLPIPGVAARTVDIETRAVLPLGKEGLLEIRGSNVMQGYLGQPERTAQAMHDGWYVTGDIATIDEDGFITITDRLSRFSKIGGEMVPHLKIEDLATHLLGGAPCAVTSLADDRRGERLALLYVAAEGAAGVTPDDLWRRLSDTDLPKLWIPKQSDIHTVDALPVLGTGKLDLRGLRTLAEAKARA